MGFVFLSHNSADKPAVEEIARRLQEQGIDPWFDAWRLVPGERWQPALEQALAQAQASVVFFGPSGVGPWQEEEMRVAIDQRVRDDAYRVIPVLLPGALRGRRSLVPAFMANVTWVEFHHGLDDEAALARLVAGIRGTPPPRAARPAAAGENPYCGLRQFDVDDSAWFFGRQALTGWLVSDIRNSLATRAGMRFLAIVGASGSGKSSLARAGLLAALRNGAVDGSGDWRYAVFKPGTHPLEALAIAVSAPLKLADGHAVTRFGGELQEAPRRLHIEASLALRDAGAGARLLLLVDQFEELFTLCRSEPERAGFVANLLEAASAPGGPTLVVVTIRSDFVGHCAAYERLAAALSDHQELVGPMRREELREAIEQPAAMTGVAFEPGLVDALLEDVQERPGALPLLQHALFELWRGRDGHRLTHAAYERIGRVQGALARRADEVYQRLDAGEQELARRVLLRLIQPGEGTDDTRRRASVEEIATSAGDRDRVERIVQRLADERLLVTDNGTVDVAHEALIRHWPQLRGWIDDRRATLRFHRRISEAAEEWQRLGHDDGPLFRGALLEDARRWRARSGDELNDAERRFLDASEALARQALADAARNRTVSDRMLWLQWGLANAAGLALAMVTLSLLMAGMKWLLDGPGVFPSAGAPAVLAVALVVAVLGAGAGSVLGAAQWLVAVRALPQLPPTRWIGASAAGGGLGLMLAASALFALSSFDGERYGSPAMANQGRVVAVTTLALLVFFVRHRLGFGDPWSRRRRVLHGVGVAVIVVTLLPLLALNWLPEPDRVIAERLVAAPAADAAASGIQASPPPVPVIADARAHPAIVAAVAVVLAVQLAFLAWHHWSEAVPRSLGRTDLLGLFIAGWVVALPVSFLLRIDTFAGWDDRYGLPNTVSTLTTMALFGAAIGAAQVFVQRHQAVLCAWSWVCSCTVGMAVGTAAVAILIPGLSGGLNAFFNGQAISGDALFFFFFPAGLLLGAFTGRQLLADRRQARGAPAG